MSYDTLFLHWGPGGTAHVERQLLSRTWRYVYFWDQPPIERAKGAFNSLIEAVIEQVDRLWDASGRPVNLIGHNFGGIVASALYERIPEQLGDCRLFASALDIPGGTRRLMRIMAASESTRPGLRNAIEAALNARAGDTGAGVPPSVWDDIELVFQDEDVGRFYWPDSDQYRRYLTLANYGPQLDLFTYRNVLDDYLSFHAGAAPAYRGNQHIQIELGAKDPLSDLDDERRDWLARFPLADIVVRPASGHFIHLEPYL